MNERYTAGVFPAHAADFPRVVDVWEASVRATHNFLTEADIQFFKPLVLEELPHVAQLACVRDGEGQVAGLIGVEQNKVEMLCCIIAEGIKPQHPVQ